MVKHVAERHLVALTPAELPAVQPELADWCLQKMRALGREYHELRQNLAVATRNRWSRGGLIKAVALYKKRIQYYQKMRAAVRAGYLMVPNFPIEVLAVRVARAKPLSSESTNRQTAGEAHPDALPVGAGRYVDNGTFITSRETTEKNYSGNEYQQKHYRPTRFDDELDFPLLSMKPQVLQATERALAQRLFDRIGLVTGKVAVKGDPIVVGQIIDPRYSRKWNEHVATFFIAWYLNTEDL